jgi:hypothetical protein
LDWLSVAVLGIIWAVLLAPRPQRAAPRSPIMTVSSEQQEFRHPGRWILSPKRGSRFVGSRARARLRARDRRRRIFLFLLEAIALTGLIGVFPPLRGMLVVTAVLILFMAIYGLMVMRMTFRAPAPDVPAADRVVVIPERPLAVVDEPEAVASSR